MTELPGARFLLTNDDGVQSEGIQTLRRELRRLGEVIVVAPDRPRSACSHAVTLHKPLRVHEIESAPGDTVFTSNGTPGDCVILGVEHLAAGPPTCVISGINAGANLGDDVTYSGTVAGAMEGCLLGIPSISISVADWNATDFTVAAEFAVRLVAFLSSHPLPSHTFLNVNVPALPAAEISGVEVTRLGGRRYLGEIEVREDPRGGRYYWRSGKVPKDFAEPDTDVGAISAGRISVTPVHMDLTDHGFRREMLADWRLPGLGNDTG